MAKFTATVEGAADATWTASLLGDHTVLGTGATKQAALDNLRDGITSLKAYLASKGQSFSGPRVELVELEVAA